MPQTCKMQCKLFPFGCRRKSLYTEFQNSGVKQLRTSRALQQKVSPSLRLEQIYRGHANRLFLRLCALHFLSSCKGPEMLPHSDLLYSDIWLFSDVKDSSRVTKTPWDRSNPFREQARSKEEMLNFPQFWHTYVICIIHTHTYIHTQYIHTRWFKYDRDWFVCKQAALRSSCATLRVWSHNLHPPSCSG